MCRPRVWWFRAAVGAAGLCSRAAAGGFEEMPPVDKLATVGTVAIVALCVKVGVLSLLLLCAILRPQQVRGSAAALRERPVRSFLLGLLAVLLTVVLAMVFGRFPEPLQGVFLLVLLLVVVYVLINGLCAVVHEIGERIQSSLNMASVGSTFAAVLYGGLLLSLVGLLPAIGQVVVAVAGAMGIGAALETMCRRRPAEREVSDAETPD